ncbi:hypothetical protein J2M53_09890 [Arthrobacter sp. zg-ZUI100]|uniref:hypothetical protein n=1 Tax=Arthrobacter jiangjiafuii TaxID=2817475 RepID=UPI001AEE0AE0|nr:hypothetical protein [Arthrobacter jiangjiafuii]MBP3036561.1 hypothetical protein [Arthrobacter jiangjiafuii]
MGKELPVHIRATKYAKPRRLLILGGPHYTFDVRYQDGEIQHDVNLDAVLDGVRYPADYWSTMRGAVAVAGDGAPGQWADYPYGRPLR